MKNRDSIKKMIVTVCILVTLLLCGCGGKKVESSVEPSTSTVEPSTSTAELSTSTAELSTSTGLYTTEEASTIDTEKLDASMALLEVILKENFGTDYSLVYDQGGVVVSFSKEGAEQAVLLAKSGNSEAAKQWGQLVEAMQSMSTTLQNILEKSDCSGIPVTIQCFDKQNTKTALAIVVDGKITYDASK